MLNITRLVDAATAGDRKAAAELLPLVYDELRQLAAARLSAETAGQTLQPTALVHEAYLRLLGTTDAPRWDNQGHFFAAAAEAMRRILVDVARRKQAQKHGGQRQRVELSEVPDAPVLEDDAILALHEGLTKLAVEDPVAAKVVELRHFGGLSIEDTAAVLGLSRATAYRHWKYARAWLLDALADTPTS